MLVYSNIIIRAIKIIKLFFVYCNSKYQHWCLKNNLMMENTNLNWISMSDHAIITSIGMFIKDARLKQNKTQAKIAKDAGINRWTLSQIEKGEAISLMSLIQILRALNLLNILDIFKIETQISPIQLAKLEKQKRQRASSNSNKNEKESLW
jgi:transcriptional regulator with XRE-family HTH domain